MNKKTQNAFEYRKAILKAVGSAFYSCEVLTKVELQSKCSEINIDANVIGMLTTAGVIKCTRGRKASISLCVTPMHILTHLDELANKMVRPDSYHDAINRRVADNMKALKEAFKRVKKENDELSALLQDAWADLEDVSAENQNLRNKIAAITEILRR
jgi:hypothetical protein